MDSHSKTCDSTIGWLRERKNGQGREAQKVVLSLIKSPVRVVEQTDQRGDFAKPRESLFKEKNHIIIVGGGGEWSIVSGVSTLNTQNIQQLRGIHRPPTDHSLRSKSKGRRSINER
jgi:hypothetical protein